MMETNNHPYNKTVVYSGEPLLRPALLCFNSSGHISDILLAGQQSFGRLSSEGKTDISVSNAIISRKHGYFYVNGSQCYYYDNGSTNGSWLNGKLCEPKRPYLLSDGDVLSFKARRPEWAPAELAFVLAGNYPKKGLDWRALKLHRSYAEITVGREQGDFKLADPSVSALHASFFLAQKGWSIIDHQSTNGVFVNHQRLMSPAYLKPMDVIAITHTIFVYTGEKLIIGRSPGQTIRMEGMSADDRVFSGEDSFRPASHESDGWGSGRAGASPEQNPWGGGRAGAAPESDSWGGGRAGATPGSNPRDGGRAGKQTSGTSAADSHLVINIEERNVWSRFKKKTLLKDISLDVQSKDMVLILGGSGAGKTTFMNAVMGYEKATGKITYDDTDIYEQYEQMKYEIGFVPQQDLLRQTDTVYDTLFNAAQMKMPASSSLNDYRNRVEEIMQLLGLEREKDSLVVKLSGGQRKRLSIATELAGNPSLFFLDEPDSGLDGIMARSLIENLRSIADMGKIVMVITHGPDRAADLFNKVIVLAKSNVDDCGHLAFYGGIREAYRFFDTTTLEGIVKKVNRTDEGGDGLSDYYINKFRG